MRRWLAVLAPALFALPAHGEDEIFRALSVPSPGRTVVAEFTDANGDGRTDLVLVIVLGMPPTEKRVIRVHLQGADGSLPRGWSHELPLPPGTAVYDLADVDPAPGIELLALGLSGITIVPLAGPDWVPRTVHLLRGATVGTGTDERGLERLPLAFTDFGPETWLLAPMFGELAVLTPEGESLATLEIGGRANFFVPPRPSIYFLEADIQLFYDSPVVTAGDVDGDGRADLTTTNRHQVRVFLRKPGGTFSRKPDREITLGLVSERDHFRGSGGVAVAPRDIDGDGRLDLLVSNVSGGFTDAKTRTTVHLNRNGGWDLGHSDRTFESDARLGSDTLTDLDGDGRLELIRGHVDFGVLEIVEILVTRSLDAHLAVYRFDPQTVFGERPWAKSKRSVPIDFETFRPKGFLPHLHGDWNGDGFLDLMTSSEGDAIEIALGEARRPFAKRERQDFDTRGLLRTGDLNGDALPDLVVFDPQHPDSEVRIGVNLGRLRGTRPAITGAD